MIAFAMEVSEYLLLSYTSSLTLSIAGILKVCTLMNMRRAKENPYTFFAIHEDSLPVGEVPTRSARSLVIERVSFSFFRRFSLCISL